MEIKKISSKLDFSVEAQCDHGESSKKGGCHADCKKSRYVAQGAPNAIFAGGPCYKQVYYTCSWSCKW